MLLRRVSGPYLIDPKYRAIHHPNGVHTTDTARLSYRYRATWAVGLQPSPV